MDSDDDIIILCEKNQFSFGDMSSSVVSYGDNQKSGLPASKGESFFKQVDEDLDYAFALSLQMKYDDEVKENADINSEKSASQKAQPLSIIDEQWELIDPHPDIHALFVEYDDRFFYGKLKSVEVTWSSRMTLCAGVCTYHQRSGFCTIRLSVPLLKLRPRRDLVETLLHEMIHAYLFVTNNDKDRDGHGPIFKSHMNRINQEAGTRISIFHKFFDEVDVYRQHWWKCDGPCQHRKPFFGLVKRAMNRAPGPQDNWWVDHQTSCGGKFMKIKEPDDYSKKKAAKRKNPSASENKGSDIRNFLKDTEACSSTSSDNNNSSMKSLASKSVLSKETNVTTVNNSAVPTKKNFIPFQGTGIKLGDSSVSSLAPSDRGSTHAKRNLYLPSSSSVEAIHIHSKIPRLIHPDNDKHAQEGEFSTTTSSDIPKKLLQSPMENFLIPKSVTAGSSGKREISNQSNIYKKEECDTLKVSCPVCFIEVRDKDINLHLDECLNNQV